MNGGRPSDDGREKIGGAGLIRGAKRKRSWSAKDGLRWSAGRGMIDGPVVVRALPVKVRPPRSRSGSPVSGLGLLQKAHPDLLLVSPCHMTCAPNVIAVDDECEVVRNAEWTGDAEACAAGRYVAYSAGDPSGSIECNRSSLQHALPLFFPTLHHDTSERK